MRGLLVAILTVTDALVASYMALYLAINLGLLVVSFFMVRRQLQYQSFMGTPRPLAFSPLVSLLVPAYNEEVTIVESLRSLLRLDYPAYEIIVVNDGSKDDTMGVLREAFGFAPYEVDYNPHLGTSRVRGLYVAEVPTGSKVTRLVLVDKENGGKADALNVAINVSAGSFVCSMDADSVLLQHSLTRVVEEMLVDPQSMVAVGVQVALSNGSVVEDGRLKEVRLPTNPVALIQVVEYMRSFTQARTGLGWFNVLLVLSGVFAVFRRDVLVAAGGFLTKHQKVKACIEYTGADQHTVCEDMEVVIRLHRYLMDRGRAGRITLIPDALAWTEAPENMTDLGKQRARWYKGLLECMVLHRGMFFRRSFGLVGGFSLPFQLAFEAASPIIELAGMIAIPLSVLAGILDPSFFLLFLALSIGTNVMISIGAVATGTWQEQLRGHRPARLFGYEGWRTIGMMGLAAMAENFVYRQILLYWRLRGLRDFLRGDKMWNKLERKGFAATAARPRATPTASEPPVSTESGA